jgi:hypothetical protein
MYIVRNPHGHSEQDFRIARMMVCEEVDRLATIEKKTAEICIKMVGNQYEFLRDAIRKRFGI